MVPPAPPPPSVAPKSCGDQVCMTIAETKAVAEWVHAMREVERAVEACNLVVRQ